jgi:hypothetical protein
LIAIAQGDRSIDLGGGALYRRDDEYCIRWMAKQQISDLEWLEDLRAIRSMVAAALHEASKQPSTEEPPSYWALHWADRQREYAESLAELMEGGVEAFAARLGEELAVEYVQPLAAVMEEIVQDSRRLWDGLMRAMAEAGKEELTALAATDFMQYVRDEIGIPWPEILDEGEVDAVVKAEGTAARFAAMLVKRVGILRRGAAAIAGRPREETLAAALLQCSALLEAQCADARALVDEMVATEYWTAFRHVNRWPVGGR